MALRGLCNILDESHSSNLNDHKFKQKRDGFEASEILIDGRDCYIKTQHVSDLDVIKWLTRGRELGNDFALGTLTSIRTVWVDLMDKNKPWTLDITETNKNSVLEHFDIKQAYDHSFTSDRGLVCLPMLHGPQSTKVSFSLSSYRSLRLSWTHDPSTGSLSVLCLGYGCEYQSKSQSTCELMKRILKDLKTLAWHPMFLVIAASVLTLTGIERAINYSREKVVEVEMRTGHGKWDDTSWKSAPGSYAWLSAQMSGIASSLAACECDRNFLDECLSQLSTYDQPPAKPKENQYIQMSSEFCTCIHLLKQRSKQAESHIRNCSRRADIQLQALFNVINQRDTQASISVARSSKILAAASKQDSTAMKILALVTVFFLPMTFIAALFSMPPATVGESAMAEKFWIYWTVSAPLTLLTIVAYVVIYWVQMNRQENNINTELKSLKETLDCPGTQDLSVALDDGLGHEKKEV